MMVFSKIKIIFNVIFFFHSHFFLLQVVFAILISEAKFDSFEVRILLK